MGDVVPPTLPGIVGVECDLEKSPAQEEEGYDNLDRGEAGGYGGRFLDADHVDKQQAKKQNHGSRDD